MRHLSLAAFAHGLASVATTAAVKTISYNSQCGAPSNFTCAGSAYGDCCAANGFCGATEKHCGIGCRSDYGICPGKKQAELKIRGYGRCQHGWTPTGIVYQEITGRPTTTAGSVPIHVTPSDEAEINTPAPVSSTRRPIDVSAIDAEPTDAAPSIIEPNDAEPINPPTPTISEGPEQSSMGLSPSGTDQFLCSSSDNECIDNFLIGCGRLLPVAQTPYCQPNSANSEGECQELCLDDEDCTGWNGFFGAGELAAGNVAEYTCCHFHDPLVLIPTATAQPELGHDWGIRNAC